MSYICIRTFESSKGITYIKSRVIPEEVYKTLNMLEQKNFVKL
jgi:hypothetical protein